MHLFFELLGDASWSTRIWTSFQLAFTIWMAVDAYHRRVEPFWYWVIVLFQPIGPWIYFFAIKLPTLSLRGFQRSPGRRRKQSIDELTYRVERTPTVANRLALAERLMDKGEHAQAIPHLEAILAFDADYGIALHSLAECKLATGAPEDAAGLLDKLIRRDYRWSNYRAWRTLIGVHEARGQPADALQTCREFEKRLPTLENKCLLAEHLVATGNATEAVALLDRALEDLHYAPFRERWRNYRWAREARRILAKVE
ncbi:MAG TPA: tetratricopeptide repeat protein [Gemmataceae bacterium]|jgi:hypothetical protein|nr:tetratricopeptide repeat protein [Gemmataceae bacterium]